MIITFSGVDGSGKSTQAAFVASLLAARGWHCTTLHMTRWTWVYKIGQRTTRGERKSASGQGGGDRATAVLRTSIALVDLLRFWLLRIRLGQETAILCDRYFYDLGIQGLYKGHYAHWFLRLYWWLSPKPDLAFLLDVPPKTAEAREGGEHASHYYEQKRTLYNTVRPPWPLVTVSTEALAQTERMVHQAVARLLDERP